MIEKWKDIPGYEGLYQVSNLGRVKSLERMVTYSDGRRYKYKEIIRKHLSTKQGYLSVSLSKDDKDVRFLVHRLIGICFIENPDNKPFLNHKNGIKSDNSLTNLEWVSAKENVNHAYENKLMNPVYGERSPFAKLNEDEVIAIRRMHKEGVSIKEISERLKIGSRNVYHICSNQTWRHLL